MICRCQVRGFDLGSVRRVKKSILIDDVMLIEGNFLSIDIASVNKDDINIRTGD